MSTSLHDLTGTRFGRLVVLQRHEPSGRYTKWTCKCDCGNLKTVHASSLKNGDTKSCGCLFREETSKRFSNRKDRITHGMSRSPEYRVWASMIDRCKNLRGKRYANYGGRGISVCDRWMIFENFITDMGERPDVGYSIERKNNDGNYEPSNCRWATRKEQDYNKSSTIMLDYKGSKITTLEASQISGISPLRIRQRIFVGWPVDDAINKPQRGD